MGDPIKALIDEYLGHAQAAFEAEKFQDAYKICLKALEIDSEDGKVLEMKSKIEDAVQNYNIHLINKEIEKLQPLWKEEKYQELVNALQQLYKAAPNYEKLEKMLSEAEEKYRDQIGKKREDSFQEYGKELERLLAEKKYNEVIEKIFSNEHFHANDLALRKLHLKIKDKLIEGKLEDKKNLMNSEKYEEIVNFLYQLKGIHPGSKKLEKLLRKYRELLLGSQLEGKRDFVFRSRENIKNLVLLGKYEFAIEACQDLLNVDPRNSYAKKTIQSCESTLKNFLREAMYKDITEKLPELKKEYAEQPENFIKL